jgi:hypothetical protein
MKLIKIDCSNLSPKEFKRLVDLVSLEQHSDQVLRKVDPELADYVAPWKLW